MCQPHSRVGPIPQEHLANTKWTLSLCVCVFVCAIWVLLLVFFCIIDSLLFSLSALIFGFWLLLLFFFLFKSEKGHEVKLVGRWKGSGRSWRGEHMIKMYCIIYNILYNMLYILLKGHLE